MLQEAGIPVDPASQLPTLPPAALQPRDLASAMDIEQQRLPNGSLGPGQQDQIALPGQDGWTGSSRPMPQVGQQTAESSLVPVQVQTQAIQALVPPPCKMGSTLVGSLHP